MMHWGWIQSPSEQASHALIVVNAMVHNRSSHDDAIIEAELVADSGDGYRAPAQESMVQAFLPEPIKAHVIEPLRLVFELPRDRLGDDLWERMTTACFTLEFTTARGRRCSKVIDLTNSFIEQHLGDLNSSYSQPPPPRPSVATLTSACRVACLWIRPTLVSDDGSISMSSSETCGRGSDSSKS